MKQQKSRKGIELPISMIIVLILTIIVFSFGIMIVFKSYRWATETTTEIDTSTQKQIEAALLEGKNIVAIPKNTAKAVQGQIVPFAIGIRNIADKTEFTVVLSFAGAYTPGEEPINNADKTLIEKEWLGGFAQQTGIKIDRDQLEKIQLRIKVGNNINSNDRTPKGTYVFNVCVYTTPQTACESATQSLTYDKQLHQVTMIV